MGVFVKGWAFKVLLFYGLNRRQVYYAILDKFTLHIYNSKYTKFTWHREIYDFTKNPQIYANHQHAAFSDYDLLFFSIPDYHGRIAACH